jgi:hypothetical protein
MANVTICRGKSGWAALLLFLIASPVCGQEEPRPGPITVLKDASPVMYGRSAKLKSVVEAIDLASREITVRSGRGRTLTMRVEERVRNLPEISVGDEVVLRYHESVGVELRKAAEDESIAVAEAEGQGDGGQSAARTTTIADVDAVSPRDKSVSIRDPDGRLHELYVRDEALLESLKAGDRVVATYTEAVVVSVEGPKEKDPKENKPKKKRRK